MRVGSKWDGLSSHLLASLYPVDRTGMPIAGQVEVYGPITEASLEVTANWQSPFEQSGPESKIPTIMSLLQTGALQSTVELFIGKGSDDGATASQTPGFAQRVGDDIREFARDGQGRSGMTKLNSTQVFTGAPPVKISLTMHFRAFDKPDLEVQQPVDQLIRWALARELAPNGNIISAIQSFRNGQGFLKALLPSQSPQLVALRYGGQLMAPMAIESISRPMTAPRTIDGEMLHVAVQLQLATLTAMDSGDWVRSRGNAPIRLYSP